MNRLCCCLFLLALANFAQNAVPEARESGEGFELELKLQNGHIPQVFIACKPGASDGIDRRMDEMAPPPGIGTGYTFLVSPDRKSNLYKDVRAPADTVQWVLFARPGGKPVNVSWDSKALPEGWNLYCARWDGKSAEVTDVKDCREVSSVSTDTLCYFRFWIARQ
jgi:hypothetical protein